MIWMNFATSFLRHFWYKYFTFFIHSFISFTWFIFISMTNAHCNSNDEMFIVIHESMRWRWFHSRLRFMRFVKEIAFIRLKSTCLLFWNACYSRRFQCALHSSRWRFTDWIVCFWWMCWTFVLTSWRVHKSFSRSFFHFLSSIYFRNILIKMFCMFCLCLVDVYSSVALLDL